MLGALRAVWSLCTELLKAPQVRCPVAFQIDALPDRDVSAVLAKLDPPVFVRRTDKDTPL